MQKLRFAVMGNPIAHSLSPLIHQAFAKQFGLRLEYERLLLDARTFSQQIEQFFAAGGRGLNITLPGKEQAFFLCQVMTLRCKQAKAANTLWIEDKKLCGDNTDGIGLVRDLKHHTAIFNKNILVLGAGGATRGILGPLLSLKPKKLSLINRTFSRARNLQALFPEISVLNWGEPGEDFDLIINATSAGFDKQGLELPPSIFSRHPFCYDLSYQRSGPTLFVQQANQFQSPAVDGLGMLVEQAAEAFYIWHQFRPDTQKVLNELRKLPSH